MSDVNVSVDDQLTGFIVHWNIDPSQAWKLFECWGFVGITSVQKVEVLNGNKARWAAKDAADKAGDGHTYFWHGDYDVGLGNDSAVYKVTYTGYDGPRVTGYPENWAANEETQK